MLYSFINFITFGVVIAKITFNKRTAVTIIKDKTYGGSKRGHLKDRYTRHKYTFKHLLKKY